MTLRSERNSTYWICQVAGWTTLALANTPLGAAFQTASWRLLATNVVHCAIGFAYTHILRLVARRWRWTTLPLRSLIPTIALAIITVAIAWHLTDLIVVNLLLPVLPYPKMLVDVVFGTAFGESVILLIWSLIYFGFHFFEGYRRAEIERWKLEAAVRDAELRALKAQMNPHFIFNSLNSVRALIAEDAGRAQEVVTRLAGLLRYSLQSGATQTVPFETELRMITDYLALESVRFEGRLRQRIEVDPRSLAAPVPPMLVQTLVENGIKYGIAKRPEGGELAVCSSIEGDVLTIRVINSGRLAPRSESTGLGLGNARARLELLFGETASLDVADGPADHVTAEIRIPLQGNRNERPDHR